MSEITRLPIGLGLLQRPPPSNSTSERVELAWWFAAASARAHARPTQQAPDSLYTWVTRAPMGVLALASPPSVHQAAYRRPVVLFSPFALEHR